MDTEFTRKYRKKLLPVELNYHQIELDTTTIQQSLDRAFDILFEEVLRRRELNAKTYPQKDIDI